MGIQPASFSKAGRMPAPLLAAFGHAPDAWFPLKSCGYGGKNINMHRTTILLPPELHRQAEKEARGAGISLGELIRRRIASPKEAEAKPGFFTRKPWVGSGPDDMATDHDRYLYGK